MIIENVELAYKDFQNKGLESAFAEFYKLPSSPKITRKLILDKDEYKHFLKSRTKDRTLYETNKDIDLTFDTFRVPFKFKATWTEFLMPSGKSLTLFEELDEPNGLTKKVDARFGDENREFMRYFDAEQYVLEQFLGEINLAS